MRLNPRALVGLLSAGLFCIQTCSFAQEATPNANVVDLSSTQQSVAATALPDFSAVSINVGEQTRAVTSTDFLTPAEAVAVMQVLAQGQQSIQLGLQGNAVGGTFQVTSHLTENLHSLVIPQGVTAVSDFANLSSINMTGDFINSGTFYAVSSSSAVAQAVINSANISNLAGAAITSVLPTGGLAGCSNLVSSLSLVLNATGNIYNAGTIASSADLTLAAGGTITNTSTSAVTAMMQAVNNVNLMSSYITNSGVIASQMGNINIASVMAENIVVNNIAGRLEAALGAINIRDAAFSEKNHTLLWGGDIASQVLNIHSGTGIVNVNVNDLIGLTNIYGGEAHIHAATNSLNLGTIELTGDPTFYNTLGDVTINSPLIFSGAPLAVVAKGDIITATGVGAISTSSALTSAGAITLIAGADVHLVSGGPDSVLPPGLGDLTTELEIRGASATGGSILLTGVTSLEAEGSTLSGTGDGGAITLIAFANPEDGSKGVISVPTGITIKTGGRHENGNVTIIAGAESGTAVTTGHININSVAATTNVNDVSKDTVLVYTATPLLTNNQYVYILGGVMTGSFTPGDLQAASMSLQSLTAKAGIISLASGANVTVTTIDNTSTAGTGSYSGGTVQIAAGGNITTGVIISNGIGSGAGGEIDIAGEGVVSASSVTANATSSGNGGIVSMYGGTSLSPGAINANRAGSGAGGKVTLSGAEVNIKSVTTTGGPLAVLASGSILSAASAGALDTSSGTSSGGAISLIAGAQFTKTSTSQLSVTGASSTGGSVRLGNPFPITSFTSRGSFTSGTGSGGNVVIVAYSKPSDGTQGVVSIPTTVGITSSGGASGGANGSVTIIAGAGTGTAVTTGAITSNIGTVGTGAITVATTAPSVSGGSVDINQGSVTSGSFALGTQTAGGVTIGNYNAAGDIYVKTASVTDTSSINTSAVAGRIDIVSDSSLSINASSGTGLILRTSSSGANTILVSASGGALTLADDRTFDAGTNGTVSFVSDVAGGAINITSGNVVTIANSTAVLRAPNINLQGANSRITSTKTSGAGLIIDNGSVASALTVRGPDSATGGTISTSGATITITANNNQDLVFSKVSGTNSSVINLNATTTTTTNNASTTIASNVAVASTGSMVFNVNNGNFTNNGTLSTTAASIAIQSTGTLQLNGTPAAAISIAASNAQMIVSAVSQLLLSSSYSFNVNSTGTASISAASVELASNAVITVSGGSSLSSTIPVLTVSTSQLTFGNASGITLNKASNLGAQFSSPTATLAVTLANNGTANIQSAGASFTFSATGTSALLDFNKASGAGTANLSITGGAVTATSGNVIAVGNSFTLSVPDITLSARSLSLGGMVTAGSGSGTVTIFPSDNQSVKFGSASSTGGVFDLNLSLLSHISAGSLVIGKSNMAGNINLGGSFNFNTVIASPLTNLTFLTAGTYNANSNSITMGSGQFTVTSGGLLTSGAVTGASPTIALTGNGFTMDGAISTTAGSISVTSTSWLGIGHNISLSSGGSLTVNQQGSNGPLILAANIGGSSTTVSISAGGWQGIVVWSGVVSANSLSLSATGGDIGSTTSRLSTAASSLAVNSPNRNAYITNSGTLTLNGSTTGLLHVMNNNNITVSGALSASSMQLITTANNGSITVSNNITSPSYLVLMANGSGAITQTAGTLSTSALYAISGSGNIGSSSTNLNTNAFYLQASTTGDAYVNSSGSVYIAQPSGGNILYVHSNGQLEIGSTINAGTLTLASGGTIIITGNVTATTATLSGSGNGNILRNGGVITATTLALSTGSGTIGTSSNKISTTASSISATNTGGLHLDSTNSGTVTVTGISSGYVNLSVAGALDATGDVVGAFGIELNSGGAMTVNDASTTNGSISFTAGGGTLTIAANSVVRADEGNLNIRNDDTTNGLILIDSGANIGAFTVGTPNASKGNVTITIGAPPGTPTAGSTPSNVSEYIVNGGQIFYGANGIDALPSTNTLNAIGGTMIFDTGSRSSSAITLGGGVTITADPPLIPDLSALPGGPDGSINLGLTDIQIEAHHLDAGFVNPIFEPIAYTSSIAPDEEILAEPLKGLTRTEFGASTIRHSQFSKFDLDESASINHHSGDILIETSSRSIDITVGKHLIRIGPKSIVLISKDKQTTKVCPLYESGSNSVCLLTGTMSTRIFPGQEVILAEDESSLNLTLQNDGIGRRKTHVDSLPEIGVLHRGEVSAISLIENNYLLTKLVQSTDAQDKQVTNKLVKVAASLMTVTSSHGPYSSSPGH